MTAFICHPRRSQRPTLSSLPLRCHPERSEGSALGHVTTLQERSVVASLCRDDNEKPNTPMVEAA